MTSSRRSMQKSMSMSGGHALGVQESLEQQRVDQWIEVGDAQGIGDKAARGGTASGADRGCRASANLMMSHTMRK